mgnify:CR=1 FL=1
MRPEAPIEALRPALEGACDSLGLAPDPAAWAALATLIVMEVVLGIDNLVFISLLSNKLPEGQRVRVRRVGIGLALVLRLVLPVTGLFGG